ncbi:hypothetical protein AALO_G00221430 [Alosa alosa]|uniref:RAD51 interacting motif domain-containing protein n=1 Tax=Alosa alosa TaxID=278164 RepID=A0AAV6G1S7_9TELE|nr:RAD51-associated protein 1 [Alosa alosa]KAG5267410.1 hypothetical protein AALO_G00221430 [Alosa alosa]
MERPSRNRKEINYNVTDFQDDDDEDFAVKAPASKKARLDAEKRKKSTVKSASQENGHLIQDRKERTPLSDKLYERDLEAALTLSMLQTTETRAVEGLGQQVDENQAQHSAPPLSNCSVDSKNHGLNDITNEQLSPKSSKQRKAASVAQSSLKKDKDSAADEDYLPQNTPDSESESDFSEENESEEEEFTIKKGPKKSKQSKGNKKTPPPKKEKQTPKATKSKTPATTTATPSSSRGLASPTISLSPVTTNTAPALKKTPATPPMSSPVLSTSPAGGRIPKWNPPGHIGRSPSTSQGAAVKSPGQGLRLGLSRMARVKPLHPNAAAH